MDRMEAMFQLDPVVSDLCLDSFKGRRSLAPEKELMLAILVDAIECFQKHRSARQGPGAKLFKEAEEWIFADNERDFFSFLNICSALDFDPWYIRRGVASMRLQAPRVTTAAHHNATSSFHLKHMKGHVRAPGRWLTPPARAHRASRAR